jgi:two-component system cell cycle sensor histidine kinase/response regulator CckA
MTAVLRAEPATTPPIRILLAEDTPADAELAEREIARSVGACEFRRVETREAYLEALTSFAPDLIVSDYQMPRFNGLTALKLALEHVPSTPVIIVTSAVNEDTAVECMRAGAVDYVIKEHKKRFGQAVTHALAEKQVRAAKAEADEQRRASEAGLREAQELARLGNWELTIPTGELRWSDEIYRIFEIDRARFGASYDAFLAMIHPDDRERVHRTYHESVANRTGYLIGHRLVMPDGRIKVVQERCRTFYDDDGAPLRSVGTVQDVTALHDAEEALRASEERFRALIEQGIDVVMTIGTDGRLEFASPSLGSTTGYTPDEVLGMHFSQLVHPDDMPQIGPLVTAVLGGTRDTVRATFRARVKTGGWRSLEGVGRNLTHVKSVRGMVVTLRDVTEQRALEERLLQAEKLDSIGRLAGAIAHDFNNVLTGILGFSEIMREDAHAGRPMCVDNLHEIQAAADRARGLTDQLLAFARKQTISPRTTDLNDVVRGTLKMLARMVGEDVELRAALDPMLWRVFVDPSQVGQVVLNLAVNARDAMPSGGRITFETANTTLGVVDAVSFPDLEPGPFVVLSVRDSGVGIAAADLPHIFEPFYTTKPEGKGTGLGLATVYGIVKQHGGHIRVMSAPGAGTTFRIYLPRALEGAVQAPVAVAARTPVSTGTETILLVEDDATVRGLTVRALRDAGYAVLEAASPDEALRMSRGTAQDIHLLLTDVVMPRMNGVDLGRTLRRERPSMRVLYLSGYTHEAVVTRGVLNAGMDLVEKPFTPSVLRDRVRRSLDAPGAPSAGAPARVGTALP